MTAKTDETPGENDGTHDLSRNSATLDPGSDGEPDAGAPKPLDDMAVAPLTEPADTSGG